jgi:hypothetical protein
MTPQSSVNFPKIDLKTAQNSGNQYKKRVVRAVFALPQHPLKTAQNGENNIKSRS